MVAHGPAPRDPALPFALVATPLTAGPQANGATPAPAPPPAPQIALAPTVPHSSPWGAAHAPQSAPHHLPNGWTPSQPFALPDGPVGSPATMPTHAPAPINPQPFPAPDAERWYAAYGQAPPPVAPPVTVRALIDAIHPAVLACLGAGALAPWLGLGVLVAPLLVVACVLGLRLTRYRTGPVRTLLLTVTGAAVLLGALAALESYDPLVIALIDGWSAWAQLAHWLLLVALPLTVGGALRRGDPPER